MPPPPLPPAHKYEEILKAVSSKSLTPALMIHYLRAYYEVDGVREFLINQMYTMADKDATFYMPQLVYQFVQQQPVLLQSEESAVPVSDRQSRAVHQLLPAGSAFCDKIYWCADSWGAELQKKSKGLKEMVMKLLSECENRMINKIEDLLEDSDCSRPLTSRPRPQPLAGSQVRLQQRHQTVSEEPNQLQPPPEEAARRHTERTWKNFLEQHQRLALQAEIFFEEAANRPEPLLPVRRPRFSFQFGREVRLDAGTCCFTQIVRIIHSEITCFETRKRVPFRIVIETVE